ncbi:hypothetical protein ACP275_14G141600 [Erythranthe tilingii]
MEKKDEKELSFSRLKFPLLPLPPDTVHYSPDHLSGTATPPLHTLASVPFKWEEQPGKPRPCTDIIALPEPTIKCLDLPPCRMTTTILPKLPSPTAVLDGPYNLARPKFSSFRFFRESRGASFDSSSSSGGGSPLSSVDVLIGKKSSNGGLIKSRRFNYFTRTLRSCNKSGQKEADGGSLGFSPSSAINGCDGDESCKTTIRRNGSFSSTHHHLWGSIYQSLKQAVAWKSTRKSKKERIRIKEYEIIYKV